MPHHACGTARLTAVAALLAAILTLPASAAAQISESIWSAMKERRVFVELKDGSEVEGRLVGSEGAEAVVLRDDGVPVAVKKSDVAILRGVAGNSAASAPAAAPPAVAPADERPAAAAPAPESPAAGSAAAAPLPLRDPEPEAAPAPATASEPPRPPAAASASRGPDRELLDSAARTRRAGKRMRGAGVALFVPGIVFSVFGPIALVLGAAEGPGGLAVVGGVQTAIGVPCLSVSIPLMARGKGKLRKADKLERQALEDAR